MTSRAYLLAITLGCSACEDFSPVDYEFPEADAAVADVSQPDSASAKECEACVVDDGAACRAEYDICAANAACKTVFDCIFAADCLRQVDPDIQTGVGVPSCATDCINAAHTSINEILLPALSLFNCVAAPEGCHRACFPQ